MTAVIILAILLLVALCGWAWRQDKRAKETPRMEGLHDYYKTLMASGAYTWWTYGTRRKARQAARQDAKELWRDAGGKPKPLTARSVKGHSKARRPSFRDLMATKYSKNRYDGSRSARRQLARREARGLAS
jgi:hypothetical protein